MDLGHVSCQCLDLGIICSQSLDLGWHQGLEPAGGVDNSLCQVPGQSMDLGPIHSLGLDLRLVLHI